jgi:hypothetical protein
MNDWDLFGLMRETKLKKSNVREIFTPHKPINRAELFFGRQDEVQSIIEQLNTPGEHSLLYGERGVGKSSLAIIASQLLLMKLLSGKLYHYRCDSSTNFESILSSALKDAGVDTTITQIGATSKKDKWFGLKLPFADGGCNNGREITETRIGASGLLSPSKAAEILGSIRGLQVIDEADRLKNSRDKLMLAEFIKHLSDSDAKFKVLVVGIADTGGDLIESHESICRCLRETKLNRMKNSELELIVTEGSKKLQLSFDDAVIDKIVELSAGYPHFTHLLALKCAEHAISSNYKRIEMKHLRQATHSAIKDAEGTLKRMYKDAIRSSNTEMYVVVLKAAASLKQTEFSARDLREAIYEQNGKEISQQALTNYFRKLVSEDSSTILRRTGKGVYRFNDPRMPSYIRIEYEDI